jgi:hypothetical protein
MVQTNIELLQEARAEAARREDCHLAVTQCLWVLDRGQSPLSLTYRQKLERLQAVLATELQALEGTSA